MHQVRGRGKGEEMTESKVKQAMAEATRFLDRANEVLAEHPVISLKEEVGTYWPSKETAALKRASMDLTRALAAMRRFQ